MVNSRLASELCERYDAEITIDGKEWGFKNFTFTAAGTMDHFSFGIRPLYAARTKAGYFHIIGCSASPRACAMSIPRLLFRKSSNPEFYEDDTAKEVIMRTKTPMTYMIDGDMQSATDQIHLKIGPRLNIIIR